MDFVGFENTSVVIFVSGFVGLYSTIYGALNDKDDYEALLLGEDKFSLVFFGIGLSYLEADEFELTTVLFVLFG